jgi:transposase
MRERREYLRRTYTTEFREAAVAAARRGERSFRELGLDLGVSPHTLRQWWMEAEVGSRSNKKKALTKARSGETETAEQRAARLEREVKRLQRENASLKMDREILKKAAAFFAKESE